MKKIYILLFVVLAMASITNAQTISRKVVSNAGGTLKRGTSQITFTLGETFSASLTADALLTQGFQQPGEQIRTGVVVASLCAGSSFSLPYTATDIGGENTFTAQLSNAAGSFASPVNVGTLLDNASVAAINVTIPANTIAGSGYRIRITSSSPAFIGTNNGTNIKINAALIASIRYSGSPYCPIGRASVTRTGQTGGTYTASPAGLSINSSTGAINLAASTAGTYSVVYSFNNASCSNTTTASITVNALPTAPVVAAQSFCSSATVASLPNGGGTYKWYTASTGVSALASTSALSTGTYYVSSVSGTCESAKVAVSVTVIKVARAGAITSANSVCTGGAISFTSSAYIGSSIQWEVSTTSATTGFSPVVGADQLVFTMDAVAYAPLSKFYVRNVVASGNCTTATCAVKTITVNPLSVAGIATGGGIICSGSNGTLKLAGYTGTIQWQSSADGTNYVNVTSGLAVAATNYVSGSTTGTTATYGANTITANTYFRAKVTSGTCSETYSNAVQYTIGTTVVSGPITATNTTVCSGTGTSLTLAGSVGTIQWQKSTNWLATTPTWNTVSNSTLATLATGNLTAATAYRAIVSLGSCFTSVSSIVTVAVNSNPLAKTITANVTSPTGTSTTLAICTSVAKTLNLGSGSIRDIQWQQSTTSSTLGFTDIEAATASSYTITNPAVGANYFRAKFTNSCGVIVYSAAFTVYYTNCAFLAKETQPLVVNTIAPFNVIAYPNPSSDMFNLKIDTWSFENVEVNVFDMSGRLVKHIESSNDQPILIGEELPSGEYITIISQGTNQKTIRLLKQ